MESLLAPEALPEPPLPMWVRIVSALGPALLFTAAIFGAVLGACISWRSGRRDRWWTKTQWAIDRVHSVSDHEQEVGLAMLNVLIDQAPSKEETALIGEAMDPLLARFLTVPHDGGEVEYMVGEGGLDGE